MIKDFIRSNTLWFFYHLYLSKIISDLISVRNGTVLDFGCGNQHLRAFVFPENKYIGFDIVKEVSMVDDYTTLKPDVVVASNVFEHMTLQDIDKLVAFCKKVKVKQIICSFPVRQWIWIRIVRLFKGKEMAENIIADHITGWADTKKILSRYFTCSLEKNYCISQLITVWE
jgi:hypothetical protein